MKRSCRGGWLRASLSALAVLTLSGLATAQGQESWDAVFMAKSKVGHMHTFLEPVKDRGRELLRVRVTTVLSFRRGNDLVTIQQEYGSIETKDGEVLRLDIRTLASDQEMRTYGDAVKGKMTITLEGGGQSQKKTIPWGPDVRGPYAPEQSFSRQPMKEDETRALKMFVPDLNKVCDIALIAKGKEDVPLGGGLKRNLLRVDQKTSSDGKSRPEFDVSMWVDDKGQVLKTAQDLMGGMVTYRTTKEGATSSDQGVPQQDRILESVAKVSKSIPDPTKSRELRYRVSLKTDDPTELIPQDRRQTLKRGANERAATLVVRTAGPNDGEPGPEVVDAEFLRPNALVTSEDDKIKSLSAKAVGNAADPWEKACRIEKWVSQNIKEKNFGTTFAPASEVARNLTGDCTEHGVLAAALCRAAGVPARVVIGLVYVPHLGGFGYHMWNEVYVNRRWVAFDATFDQTAVDATHIKLSETSLDGVAPFEAFLPVARVLGKITLEPIEAR